MPLFQNIADDLHAAGLEFCGTVMFLLLGLGGIQASVNFSGAGQDGSGSSSDLTQIIYASVSMGLALLAASWVFFRVKGGLFNPNVSTALLILGIIGPVRFVLYCIAQIVGAIVASALLQALLPGPLTVKTVLVNRTSIAQGVFIEMFITAALILSVLVIGDDARRRNAMATTAPNTAGNASTSVNAGTRSGRDMSAPHHRIATSPAAPIGIGLTFFACHLWAFGFTGASMNTARSFGPAVLTGFRGSHWIYWVGPLLGALLASGVYMAFKGYRYWRLNAGNDDSDHQDGFYGHSDGVNGTGNTHHFGRKNQTEGVMV